MWQLILKLQRRKQPNDDQGFSMVEVLVSILVTSAFVMGTLQAMVINAWFQVRAEREAQATFWIQEDMEKVKAIAELFSLDESDPSPCSDGVGDNAFQNGFGGKLRDELPTYSSDNPGSENNFQIADEKYLVNKQHRLIRIIEGTESSYAVANQSPHVLKITYMVGEIPEDDDQTEDGTNGLLKRNDKKGFNEILAQVYTEVIPSGAFACSSLDL